jgi:hypothetical protein
MNSFLEMLMPNNRIVRTKKWYNDRIPQLDDEKLQKCQELVKLSFEEWMTFQKWQSVFFADGKLEYEESQLIYLSLGGESYNYSTFGWDDDVELSTKMAIQDILAMLKSK